MNAEVDGRIVLRQLSAADRDEFIARALASEALHRRWINVPTTSESFGKYLAGFDQPTAVGFVVRLRTTNAMAGFVNINRIERAFEKGTLGYGAFVPHNRHGYMAEGVAQAVHYGFERLGLHRLEADIEPENTASLRLAERVSLRKEGFSPALIKINGKWRDFERWAIINPAT
jgi:ribosomal-protein-alanine N-acetyltransferase